MAYQTLSHTLPVRYSWSSTLCGESCLIHFGCKEGKIMECHELSYFSLDFIESESFSYLNQLLDKNEACLLKLKVNLPTVTKPRIKVSEVQLIIIYYRDLIFIRL